MPRERDHWKETEKGSSISLFSDFVTISYGESWDSSNLVKNNESQSRTIESQFKNTSTRGL